MHAGGVASCGPFVHGGAWISHCSRHHCAGRRPASMHLVDFGSDSVKVELIIVGLMVRKVYRWRGAGEVAWGKAGDVAGGSIDLGQRPAVHQLCNFLECMVNVVVGIVI